MGVVKRVLPFCLLAFLPLGVCAQEDIDIDEDDIIVTDEDGEECRICAHNAEHKHND